MSVPYEKQFHFRDGTSVESLEQLKAKLESIGYQEFYHHVNPQKNDFASWIKHVLRDEHLADDLQKVSSIVETVEIIDDYLHPRPVTTPRIDVQSRIEQSLFSTPMPAETEDRLTVETVPTTAPIAEKSDKLEPLDFTIIEEKMDQNGDGLGGSAVQQELFGSAQPEKSAAREEVARLIVNEFMFGLLFGLVVGFILGRILSL